MGLRDIRSKAIKPLFVTEKHLNLFGHRYNAMLEARKNLSPLELDRMHFFIAVAERGGLVPDYVGYIRQMKAFCERCARDENSGLAKNLDMDRIHKFKITVDLLEASISSVGKDYMDRVRAEMPVPLDDEARKRAAAAELAAIREDLVNEINRLRADK